MEDKQYELAIEMLEQARFLLPSNIDVRASLAQAYRGMGRADDAARTARSVVAWSHEESAATKVATEVLAELAAGDEQ